ncbi:hypothetical protein P3441_14315 [Vibrio parahaemolyticus]|nr:hypothetical protein [Vibrio parahaemolyticus]MDF4451252.1 hypothetical protein [Vibrio parahaemolyticus]
MTLEELSHFGALIAAIAACVSVLLALKTYVKGSLREAIKDVRENVAKFNVLYNDVDRMLDTSCSVELGVCISNEIKELIPSPHTTKSVADFLANEENISYLDQACYMGLSSSNTVQQALKVCNELYIISSKEREMFPITSALFSCLSAYPNSIINTINQTEYLVSLLTDQDSILSLKGKEISEGEEHILFRDIALWVTFVSDSINGNIVEVVSEGVNPIIDVVSKIFERSSDSKLLKISKNEKKSYREFIERSGRNQALEAHEVIYELLQFYRKFVSASDWDVLVESKTILSRVNSNSDRVIG